jgi:hypothetical protein
MFARLPDRIGLRDSQVDKTPVKVEKPARLLNRLQKARTFATGRLTRVVRQIGIAKTTDEVPSDNPDKVSTRTAAWLRKLFKRER